MITLHDKEFRQFQQFIFDSAGITLNDSKKALVSGRLEKRLRACEVNSYGHYLELLKSGQAPAETQLAIDLLTTNETYFFREMKHFDLLRKVLSESNDGRSFRIWSAASSSGEEAYSMAMVLADCRPAGNWEVFGSDISLRILKRARVGHYPMERAEKIPKAYLQKYCLKGIGQQAGTLLIDPQIKQRVSFAQINLNEALPRMGSFDMIFLRNVMIYFSNETKREIVERVLQCLRPGGYFCIGHSESLNGISDSVRIIAPSIYRKP